MRELKMMKKLSKGLLSLLLALTLLLSLGVPLTVFAEEEVAEGNEIYALVYDIRAKSSDGNSLVMSRFSRGEIRSLPVK